MSCMSVCTCVHTLSQCDSVNLAKAQLALASILVAACPSSLSMSAGFNIDGELALGNLN